MTPETSVAVAVESGGMANAGERGGLEGVWENRVEMVVLFGLGTKMEEDHMDDEKAIVILSLYDWRVGVSSWNVIQDKIAFQFPRLDLILVGPTSPYCAWKWKLTNKILI